MKHILLNTILVAFLGAMLISCEKEVESADISRVTYYADIVIEGNEYMVVHTGSEFTDPGATAYENGEEIPMTTTGEVDANTPGVYSINYTASNSDGFPKTVSREVRVVTPGAEITDISGTYAGLRLNKGEGGNVIITKIAPGVFEVEDFLAGYYWQAKSYGLNYSAPGIFTQNPDGTFTASQGFVPGWGDVTEAQDLTYDPIAKVFTYYAYMVGGDFGFSAQLTFVE